MISLPRSRDSISSRSLRYFPEPRFQAGVVGRLSLSENLLLFQLLALDLDRALPFSDLTSSHRSRVLSLS
jgi:hypothetical protein